MQQQHVNRAEQLWKNWEEKQNGLESLVGLDNDSRTMQKLKYDFLRQGVYRLSVRLLEKEELYLQVIRSVVAKLEKQLYPNFIIRTLHRLKAMVYDKPVHLKKFEVQKAENLEQLTRQLAACGFASFTGKLDNYLDYERSNINIPMTTQLMGNYRMDIGLKLERDQAGHYRYTEYQARLYREGELWRSYTFPEGSKITAIEAANMLEGRAVNKSYQTADGSISQKWVQFDFSSHEPKLLEFHQDYGYELKKELMKTTGGLGLYGCDRNKIVKDLERGNLIGLEIPGKGSYYLYANPAERSLSLLDAEKRLVTLSALINEVKGAKVSSPEVTMNKESEKKHLQDQSLRVG